MKLINNGDGYLFVNLSRDNNMLKIKVHKLVAMAFLKHIPNGMKTIVDHINNIKTDNRVINLQLTTNRINCSKDVKNSSSKYTGVTWVKRDRIWKAQIKINNRNIYLGTFNDEYVAHLHYLKALKELKNN